MNAHPSHATTNAPVAQTDATKTQATIVPIMFPIRATPFPKSSCIRQSDETDLQEQ